MSPSRNKNPDTTGLRPSIRDDNVTRVHSADLFRKNRRLIIEHQGEEYCLRLTRNERLILTKF